MIDPNEQEAKNENGIVVSLERISMHFKFATTYNPYFMNLSDEFNFEKPIFHTMHLKNVSITLTHMFQ